MTSEGRDALVVIGPAGRPLRPVPQPCVAISGLCAHQDGVAYIGSTPDGPASVWTLTPTPVAAPASHAGRRLPPPAPPTPAATPFRLHPCGYVPSQTPHSLSPHPTSRVGEPFSFEGRTGRRIHGLVYRPTLAGTVGPPGCPPSLGGGVPLRADGIGGGGLRRGRAVLLQPWLRPGRRGLRRQHRLRTGLPLLALGAVGGPRLPRLRRCGAVLGGREQRVDGTRMAVRGTSSGGLGPRSMPWRTGERSPPRHPGTG